MNVSMEDLRGRAANARPRRSENAATTPRLPQEDGSVKRPSMPERPADVLRRLASKSRRWRW
jgi:hypothetical protein